jgi:hypothetical protein
LGVLGVMFIATGEWHGICFGLLVLMVWGFCLFLSRSWPNQRGASSFIVDRQSAELRVEYLEKQRKEETVVSKAHDLSKAIGVQLLYSGHFSISHADEYPSSFHTYEMNVMFAEESISRLHICTHSDWAWMREVGELLSEFLDIPVVDQLHHGE